MQKEAPLEEAAKLSMQKEAPSEEEAKPSIQKQAPSEEEAKPSIQKETAQTMNHEDLEFDTINPLKDFMFSIVLRLKALIHFISPEKKYTSKNSALSNVEHNKIKDKISTSTKTSSLDVKLSTPKIKETHQVTASPEEEEDLTPLDLDMKEDNTQTQTPQSSSEKALTPITPVMEEDNNKQSPQASSEKTPITPVMEEDNNKQSPQASSEKTPIAPVTEEDNKQSPQASSEKTPIAPVTEEDNKQSPQASSEESLHNEKDKSENTQTSENNTSTSFVILDQKQTASLDQLSPLRRALEDTKKYVNSYVLFVFKKDLFIPYKWNSNLTAPKKTPGTIQKPSIFRIVYMSKQPYFGHVAPVLANNSFFNQWGFEELPKNIMLIPFLDAQKNVLGAYLGISKTRTLPVKCLYTVEQILQPINVYYEDGSLLKKVS